MKELRDCRHNYPTQQNQSYVKSARDSTQHPFKYEKGGQYRITRWANELQTEKKRIKWSNVVAHDCSANASNCYHRTYRRHALQHNPHQKSNTFSKQTFSILVAGYSLCIIISMRQNEVLQMQGPVNANIQFCVRNTYVCKRPSQMLWEKKTQNSNERSPCSSLPNKITFQKDCAPHSVSEQPNVARPHMLGRKKIWEAEMARPRQR